MADMNKIKRIEGGTLKTVRAQDATIPLNVQTYSGPYTVTPTAEQQTLNTRNRILSANVTVEGVDYDDLENKPQVNGVTLQGNKSLEDLGIASAEDVQEKYTKPDSGIPASDIADGVIPDVSGFYTKPASGIPATDIASGVIPDVSGFYTKPSGGIPAADIADGVIPDVSGFYEKPATGIPATDIADGVIPDVSGFYTKPAAGIPASDIASGVIPDVTGKLDAPSTAGTQGQVLTSDGNGGQTWEDPQGGGGTGDYTDLDNKPQINSVTLTGNKSLSDLSIASASDLAGKQAKITASGILKGDGSGGVTAATAGTDYGTYSKPSGGIPSTDMASAVQTSLGKADTAYQKPSGGIPSTDMASAVQTSLGKADTAYQKPSGGIPSTDMTSAVQTSLGKADSAYQKPSGGIPSTDLASAVQTSLGKADTAYQKPSGGIPASDLASGVLPDSPMIPVFTATSATTGTCDKTFAEIVSAINAGTCNRAKFTNNGITFNIMLDGMTSTYVSFHYIFITSTPMKQLTKLSITLTSQDAVMYEQYTINDPIVPVFTFPTDYTGTCSMTFAEVLAGVQSGACSYAAVAVAGNAYELYTVAGYGTSYISFVLTGFDYDAGRAVKRETISYLDEGQSGRAERITTTQPMTHATAIADDYDAEETYSTGDHVMHDSYLYVCNSDNVTGTWNSQYWDAESVTERIDGVQTNLTALDAMKATVDGTPSNGDFLVYSSSAGAWVPTTMAAWQGGSY